jgi:hypothetical protein
MMCENVEGCTARQATDDNKIWHMQFASWITKATHIHIHRECNTYCVPTATMVTQKRYDVTLYVTSVSGFSTVSQEHKYSL